MPAIQWDTVDKVIAQSSVSIVKVMCMDTMVWQKIPTLTPPSPPSSGVTMGPDDAQIVVHYSGIPAGESFDIHWTYVTDVGYQQSDKITVHSGAENPIIVSPTHHDYRNFFIFNGFDSAHHHALVWLEYKGHTTATMPYSADQAGQILNIVVDFSQLYSGQYNSNYNYV